MTPRERVVGELLARAERTSCRVFGYCSRKAGCEEMKPKKGVPSDWNRICVEGDENWSYLPPAEETGTGDNGAAA